jgi:histidine triad (HIT) family protein
MSELPRHEPAGYDCPFCALARGRDTKLSDQSHIVERTDETFTVVSPRFWPNNKGHLIVVTLEHHENLYVLPDHLGAAVHRAARRAAIALKGAYECGGTSTRQHNEPAGYQDVWHYHLHVYPRYAGDNLYRSEVGGLLTKEEMTQYARRVQEHLAMLQEG